VDFQFRNQQVAGSSPTGGSRTPLKTKSFLGRLDLSLPHFCSNCAKTPSRGLTCARTPSVVRFAIQLRESLALQL
jgi:hypothetical protein